MSQAPLQVYHSGGSDVYVSGYKTVYPLPADMGPDDEDTSDDDFNASDEDDAEEEDEVSSRDLFLTEAHCPAGAQNHTIPSSCAFAYQIQCRSSQ